MSKDGGALILSMDGRLTALVTIGAGVPVSRMITLGSHQQATPTVGPTQMAGKVDGAMAAAVVVVVVAITAATITTQMRMRLRLLHRPELRISLPVFLRRHKRRRRGVVDRSTW